MRAGGGCEAEEMQWCCPGTSLLCLLGTWDANPAVAGELKGKTEREKGSTDGRRCIDLRVQGSAVLEKPGASPMPNPGAVGLGKAKDVIEEKPLPACCV